MGGKKKGMTKKTGKKDEPEDDPKDIAKILAVQVESLQQRISMINSFASGKSR